MISKIDKIMACVVSKPGSEVELVDDIQIPDLRRGQVLVKLEYAGVCHSQLMEARGLRGEDKFLPHMFGHEGVGTVLEIGPDVSKVSVGDRVILTWVKDTGIETGGSSYHTNTGRKINSGPVATLATSAIVSENRLVKKPPFTPLELCPLYGCAMLTGAGIILNQVKSLDNSTIVIFGLGGVGLSALMAARYLNPIKLLAVDMEEHKLNLATALGATDVIQSSPGIDLKTIVYDLLGGNGADFVIESAGKTSTIEQGFSLLKANTGKLYFASHPASGQKISLDPFELISGKKIFGSWGGCSKPSRDIPILDQLYAKGAFDLKKLLSEEYSLTQINGALNDLEHRKINRALIRIC